MPPRYDLDKIRFSVDQQTLERAFKIYDSQGILCFEDFDLGYRASVRGSGGNVYHVYVSAKNFDQGTCDCYLGQENVLCKHMVAVALRAVSAGKKIGEEELSQPQVGCSDRVGSLSAEELAETRGRITAAIKFIKSYNGPSRIWFAYQNSLTEGCARLTEIVSSLPVSPQTAGLLVDLLLRLDKKLRQGGVDDSDGTVGGFMTEVASMLVEFAEMDNGCIKTFEKIAGRQTCFEWDETLVRISDEGMDWLG